MPVVWIPAFTGMTRVGKKKELVSRIKFVLEHLVRVPFVHPG